MELDTAANPAGGEDTHVVDTAAPSTVDTGATAPAGGATDTDTDNGAGDAGEIDDFGGLLSPDIGEEEVEYEGAKYKVPAPLKDALLRQADYTQKTMTLAEERRAVEAQQSQIQEAQRLSAAEIAAFSDLNSLNADLAEFQGIDWTSLDHSDPQVQHAKGVRDETIRKHQLLTAQINAHMSEKNARAQREAAKERETVDRGMAKIVKDWTPEKRRDFEAFAVEQGIPPQYAGQAGLAEMKILRLAMIGSRAEQQRTSALAAAAKSAIRPAHEVGAAAGSGSSDPSAMSMDQYKAWRAKQQ